MGGDSVLFARYTGGDSALVIKKRVGGGFCPGGFCLDTMVKQQMEANMIF